MDIITDTELDLILKSIDLNSNINFTSRLNLKSKLQNTIQNINSNKKSTEHLINKIITLYSFKIFCEKVLDKCTSIKIYGSFIRQIFEKAFIYTFDNSGYGACKNHDIDISIFDSEEAYKNHDQMFWYLINTFQIMVGISESDEKFKETCLFNGYHIKQIINLSIFQDEDLNRIKFLQQTKESYEQSTDPYLLEYAGILQQRIELIQNTIKNKFIGIPHFNIILYNPQLDDNILIDLLGHPITHKDKEDGKDLNINTLEIKNNIISADSDFMEILYMIAKRTGICRVNFNSLINRLEGETLLYSDKSIIYNSIINFVTTRTKILALGYTGIYTPDVICDFTLESEERCEITDLNPPYLKINLKCGHSLSVMALSGITNIRTSEYSEAIQCPMCRDKLIPNLITKKINEVEIPSIENIYTFPKEIVHNVKKERIKLEYVKNNIISDENVDYVLKNIYNIQDESDDDINDEINDDINDEINDNINDDINDDINILDINIEYNNPIERTDDLYPDDNTDDIYNQILNNINLDIIDNNFTQNIINNNFIGNNFTQNSIYHVDLERDDNINI